MSDLIKTLEEQHRQIVAHLEAIRNSTFKREVAVRELKAAKALILAHLALEDSQLYQPMLKTDRTQALAQEFQKSMQPIGQDVMAFFAAHDLEKSEALGMDFAKDLGRLLFALNNRIRQEEGKLYPAFRQPG